jgi:hypothetical protein
MKSKTNSQIKKSLIAGGNSLKLKSSNIRSENINLNLENFYLKKIIFNSAFDHKGSKHFLHSKKAALQQIIIDDDDSSNNDDTQTGSNKEKKNLKNIFTKPSLNRNKENRAKSSNNLFYFSNYKLKNKIQDIENHNNKKNGKEHLIHTFPTKKYSPQKKMNKNFSSQELKMFKDKAIQKIKPIKKSKNNIESDYNHKNFPFVESENSSVSSLFKIVSQIK